LSNHVLGLLALMVPSKLSSFLLAEILALFNVRLRKPTEHS
jgi:hypothetical protein